MIVFSVTNQGNQRKLLRQAAALAFQFENCALEYLSHVLYPEGD